MSQDQYFTDVIFLCGNVGFSAHRQVIFNELPLTYQFWFSYNEKDKYNCSQLFFSFYRFLLAASSPLLMKIFTTDFSQQEQSSTRSNSETSLVRKLILDYHDRLEHKIIHQSNQFNSTLRFCSIVAKFKSRWLKHSVPWFLQRRWHRISPTGVWVKLSCKRSWEKEYVRVWHLPRQFVFWWSKILQRFSERSLQVLMGFEYSHQTYV